MKNIQALLQEYLEGSINPADQVVLDEWVATSEEHRLFFQELNDPDKMMAALRKMESYDEVALWQKIQEGRAEHAQEIPTIRRVRFLWRWWAAAAIVICLIGGTYFWVNRTPQKDITKTTSPRPLENDVLPGGNKAVLTLSGGKQIILDSAANGNLARQGNAQIQKLAGGQVAYQRINEKPTVVLYNTLTTPRGGQYQLTLPDGTKVWLNAASSITYPVAFIGADRKVTITGEAYLEVVKDVLKPFKINIRDRAEVEVLGTSFNVNAYDDERDIKTTLLEGAVRVATTNSDPLVGVNTNKDKGSVVLKPGQQAQVVGVNTGNGRDQIKVLPDADTEQAVAWKNGRFAFSHADLPTVMRQLARWYNVEVTYEAAIPVQHFSGRIGKFLTLDQLLKVLTQSRVHYRIEAGNKLIIRP